MSPATKTVRCGCGVITSYPTKLRARCRCGKLLRCGTPLDEVPSDYAPPAVTRRRRRRRRARSEPSGDDVDDELLPGCGGCH